MIFRKCIFALSAVAMFAASAAVAQTSSSSNTRTFDFPPVGLASSETLQINVLNSASASSSGTAASCSGSISFVGPSGAVGSAASFTIASGEVFSASLPFAKLSSSATRAEVVGVISMTTTSGTPCGLRSSLETFDTSSGVTHVFIGGPGGGPGFGGGPGGPPPGR